MKKEKVVDFKLEPVVSQTKKTQPNVTSVLVPELKPTLMQRQIKEVPVEESKTKTQPKITSVPIEE